MSATVARLNLAAAVADEAYWDVTAKKAINRDAFNLSGSEAHNASIAGWIEGLATTDASDDQLTKLLKDLTSRNTYGTFAELAVYGTLAEHGLRFAIQVPATAKDILNPNGSELDGEIDLSGGVLFDVKAFGLQEHLVELLVGRLNEDLAPGFVAAEGSWDIAVEYAQGLLREGYAALRTELATKTVAHRGLLELNVRPRRKVQVSVRRLNPYTQAEKNSAYAFKYAKQFARRKPFILAFVLHPWMGGQSLSLNFADHADIFTRAFARRTFMQFTRDRQHKHFGVTRAAASRLLSGLMFIDAWAGPDPPKREPVRLYLNPNAKHPVLKWDVDLLRHQIPHLAVEDFHYDNY